MRFVAAWASVGRRQAAGKRVRFLAQVLGGLRPGLRLPTRASSAAGMAARSARLQLPTRPRPGDQRWVPPPNGVAPITSSTRPSCALRGPDQVAAQGHLQPRREAESLTAATVGTRSRRSAYRRHELLDQLARGGLVAAEEHLDAAEPARSDHASATQNDLSRAVLSRVSHGCARRVARELRPRQISAVDAAITISATSGASSSTETLASLSRPYRPQRRPRSA